MDDYLRDLERRSGDDPAIRLQLELARIRAGIWLPPEERFLRDVADIIANLVEIAYKATTPFRPDDFRFENEVDDHARPIADISNAGDLSIHHVNIFTTREVNEPDSYLYSQFIVAVWLVYPTLPGVINAHNYHEYYGIRNVAPVASPAYKLASDIEKSLWDIFLLLHTHKISLSNSEITKVSNDIKLQSKLCGHCNKIIRFSRAYANTNWPIHLGQRQTLWDFSGQVQPPDSHDDVVGISLTDPQNRTEVRCLACMNTAPI